MYKGVLAMAALFFLLSGDTGWAQQAPRQQMPQWDPNTVQTVKGTVAGTRQGGRVDMIVVQVKPETGEPAVVVLGPKQVLDPALASLAAQTPIEVTGSKVKGRERELIMAS
jgi:hypothetical protein